MENPQNYLPLREPTFYILLSLSPGPKHGYAILKEVEALSDGRVLLSTGTLYGAIKRLLDDSWICRVDDPLPNATERERKAYVLTEQGKRVLNAEIVRLQKLVNVGMKFQRLWLFIYNAMLSCYPLRFRAEFGPEMKTVFASAVAHSDSFGQPGILFWRELRSWPRAILREYLHYWKGARMESNNPTWRPLSRKELLVGLLSLVITSATMSVNSCYLLRLSLLPSFLFSA